MILAGTAIFSFTADPIFEARVELLVEKSKLNMDVADLLNPLSSGARNEIENRIEVIYSDPVLQRALDRLSPDAVLLSEMLDLNELRQHLIVRPIRNTDLIEIYARAHSPTEAKLIANTVAQAYLDQDREMTKETISNVKNFLEVQLDKTKTRLESSESTAVQFQKLTGLIETTPEDASKNLIELQKFHTLAQIELKDKQGALGALDKLLDEVQKDLLGRVSDPRNVNILLEAEDKLTQIRKLQDEVAKLEQERQGYLDSQDYLKAQQLQEVILQKRRAIEHAATSQFPALELFPKYEELIRQQLALTLEIEALKNRVEVIKAKMDEETKKLMDNGLELLRFKRNLDVDKSIYVLLRQEYEKSRIAEAGQWGTVRVINWATEPMAPIAPKKGLNLLVAAVSGLVLGLGVAFLFEYFDNTYKNPKDIEKEFEIAHLGAIPAMEPPRRNGAASLETTVEKLILDRDMKDPIFNAYLTVEANLRFTAFNHPLHVLLITSSIPNEGKSTTAANLGLMLSVAGKKTLVIDSDLRKPVLAKLFGLSSSKGLSNLALAEISIDEAIQRPIDQRQVLEGGLPDRLMALGHVTQKEIDHAIKIYRQEGHYKYLGEVLLHEGLVEESALEAVLHERRRKLANLHVLPAGTLPPNPTALLGSERMDQLIATLKKEFEIILFDSPPVTAVPDAAILSAKVDGALLVIEAQRTDREAVRYSVDQFQKTGGHLAGFILNKVQKSQAGTYYGYGYEYYGRDPQDQKMKISAYSGESHERNGLFTKES
jgi:capsular exopolysaccharide synthesis family protein